MGVFEQQNDRLLWRGDGELLVIEPWGANSLRVRSVMLGELLDTDFALLPQEQRGETPEITFDEREAGIRFGKVRAAVTDDGWSHQCVIRFYNQKDELLLEEYGGHGSLALRSRQFKGIAGGDFRLTATFASNPDEKLYGMGQYQQDILDIKGCSFELAHRNAQASVPFVLSSLGYGFLWHNPAVGRAAFAKNRTEWVAESTKQLDYWITAGDTPAEIEEAYARATGTVPMMPEYGLGFWQCKLRYYSQEQVLEVVRAYKRRGLPLGVIVIDFFHWPKMGDFRFEDEFFPDPAAMAKELESLGVKLMVSVWPQIDQKSENFNEMRQKGLLVKPERGVNVCMQFGGDSVFFDATNPRARDYVWQKCKKNYYDKGVSLFWLDEAEPEYHGYDFDNYRYYLGPDLQIGNLYPQMFSRTFYDGMRKEGRTEIVNLVRCAWAGSQRYGALVWSGDIHSDYAYFRMQVCAGLQMGLCGIPWWTTDIGGFSGGDPQKPAFRELLVRWFQYGAFCPVMRLHGDRIPSAPVTRKDGSEALATGGGNEVWSYGEEVYGILVKYLRLREALRPYTRELMRQAHEKGTPVMRAMFYEFPDDAACWDLKDQYLFGPDLLVAPVVREGAAGRAVYLPAKTRWTSLHDGRVFEGGQTIQAEAPLDVIPVFAKNGSHADLVGSI